MLGAGLVLSTAPGLALLHPDLRAALGNLAADAIRRVAPDPDHGPEVYLAGDPVSLASLESRLTKLEQAFTTAPVVLIWDGTRLLDTTWSELGINLDVEETRRTAELALQRDRDWRAAFSEASPGERIDLVPVLRLEASTFINLVLELKDEFDVPGRPARYDWKANSVTPPRAGHYIDVDTAWQQAVGQASKGAHELSLHSSELTSAFDAERFRGFHPTTVIGSFETRFSRRGDDARRAENIETAAAHLQGTILMPGQLLSFNELVGKRSLDNGFKESWQIYKGEMVRGVGGGTCQVSSTLHAAALYAGLEIVDRFPHSRALAYIPVGLDSTVAWPAVDLKMRNAWDFPVVIDTLVKANSLTVTIMAERNPAKRISVRRKTLEVIPYERQVEVKRYFEPDRVKLKQKGVPGYRVLKTRSILMADGAVRSDQSTDYYPPTPELYFVGQDVDAEQDLPPLPQPDDGEDA